MPENTDNYKGRIAVITGASSGIGYAIADRLQLEGANVSAFDRVPRKTVESPPSSPVTFYQVDVAQEREVEAAFRTVVERWGKIDYLICCAAVFRAKPFLQLSEDEWRQTMDVNLSGGFLCCRAAIRYMLPRRFGRIILFSSMLARTGGKNCAHYSASKGGVLGLARSLALEVAGENIRVNTISPGVTDTPQPRDHLSEEELYGRGAGIPLGRIGTVEDMGEGCLFLLSENSAYFTAQDLRINGGASLW